MMGGIAVLLAMGLLLPGAAPPLTPVSARTPYPSAAIGPIAIEGNSGFGPWNGVVAGDGSAANPFLIAGWEIDATNADGIRISNTTAAFRISNVTIRGAYPSAGWVHSGISLTNVVGGLIDHVNVTTLGTGVMVLDSVRVFLVNSTLANEYGSVKYANVSGGLIEGNTIQWTAENGLYVQASMDIDVRHNTFTLMDLARGWDGISLQESTRIALTDNLVTAPEGAAPWGYGIHLAWSTYVDIEGNVLRNRAIYIQGGLEWAEGSTYWLPEYATHTITPDNLVNGRPVLLYANVDGLTLNSSAAGEVILVGARNVTVSNQYFVRSEVGIFLAYGYNVVIRDSDFTFMRRAIAIANSRTVSIFRNNFNVVGAEYSGRSIVWNLPYPAGGNFWSDYGGYDRCSGPDQIICPDPDGFGDFPEWSDNLPVMTWINHVAKPPVACFEAQPLLALVGEDVRFDARCASDPGGASSLTFRWDWNGDWRFDTNRSATSTAVHAFRKGGSFPVRVEVKDAAGNFDVFSLTITVQPAPCFSPAEAWTPWLVLGIALVVAILAAFRIRRIRSRPRIRAADGDEDTPNAEQRK